MRPSLVHHLRCGTDRLTRLLCGALAGGLPVVACFHPEPGQDVPGSSTSSSTEAASSTGLAFTGSSTGMAVTSSPTGPEDGTTSTSTTEDGSTTVDGSGDSTTGDRSLCNQGPTPADALAFGPVVPLAGINTDSEEPYAWLSPDELAVWFTSGRPGGLGGYGLYRSTRDDLLMAFGPAVLLTEVSTAGFDGSASLTTDMLTLYAHSNGVESQGGYDVLAASRASTIVEFGMLTPVANINSVAHEADPFITADGMELYLSTTRDGTWDIYRAQVGPGGSFGMPSAVGELNVPGFDDSTPILSADGLTIYFTSTRDNPAWEIYVATRSTRNDGFGPPVSVTDLNSGFGEWPAWLSPDGCRLVFVSNRPGEGGTDLWVAEREL